jgi:hypothetical protein
MRVEQDRPTYSDAAWKCRRIPVDWPLSGLHWRSPQKVYLVNKETNMWNEIFCVLNHGRVSTHQGLP